MEKEYVSYEQAVALKELGFDEMCLRSFYKQGKVSLEGNGNIYDTRHPLKQQVFRWFREKYEIHGFIIHYSRVMFRWCIDSGDDFAESIKLDTYEEAENACIDKLIEIAKQQ